VINV